MKGLLNQVDFFKPEQLKILFKKRISIKFKKYDVID